jgi:hypothetical protein
MPREDAASTILFRRTAPPRTALGRWLFLGGALDEEAAQRHTHPWYLVLWLTGVDYFSTLGYQPGIALLAAGALSPIATAFLVVVTLLGALPTYSQVASRSYVGQGSIAMLEHLLPGWLGKVFVLILLGFAATDFVITMTLSAADAAQHAIENPYLNPYLGEARLTLTIGLLALLALVFLKGFLEAIGLAAAVAIPYLLLNVIVLVRGIIEIALRPEVFRTWQFSLAERGDWTATLLASALLFPKLALGLSGFETGVTVMPLVSGQPEDPRSDRPWGRIHATRKLLATAALIMSCLLVTSSLVTTLLIPETAYRIGGPASGRAVAYLAHDLLGPTFGSVYDISTILILWFAGASAMAGLLSLIPRYLPRFGMAPRWASYRRPLVFMLFAACVIVTLAFDANVEAQGGAYATGVLVLILSAALAVALGLWKERARLLSAVFWLIGIVFAFTLVDNVIERPDGLIIATVFIIAILAISAISRFARSTELRVLGLDFADPRSQELWQSLRGKKIHLVPIRDPASRKRKMATIRRYHNVPGPLAFIHVNLLNNRSEFLAPLRVQVSREGDHYAIEVSGAIAIANTIAYISELLDPISIFLGLTRQNLMRQALRYVFWGEGETGLMVYTILVRYWEWTPEEDVRPLIFLLSD